MYPKLFLDLELTVRTLPNFEKEKEFIYHMLEANGYGVRHMSIPGDDFRIFLTPPGIEVESEEVFKVKGNDNVCCGAEILMGGEIRDLFFKQSKSEQEKFKEKIENLPEVKALDFFEIADDGSDFKISIRAEFPTRKLSEDSFADAMNRLNSAGGSIEDLWGQYF